MDAPRVLPGFRGPIGCLATAEAKLLVLAVAGYLKVEDEVDRDGCMYGELLAIAVRELPRLGDRTLSSGTSLRLPTLGESTLSADPGMIHFGTVPKVACM